MSTLAINKHYSFSVFANSILGTNFKNAKLIGILDYTTALKNANIELLHRQIYPYLPPGTVQDQTKYTYYLFSYNGGKIVLADVWILTESIQETEGLNYTLRLNNITSPQMTVIRNQLRLLGVSFDIL